MLTLLEQLSLQYHETLNPALWDKEDNLDGAVRHHLLAIADAWIEHAKIPHEAVTNIVLHGGAANYNYTEQSDIDLSVCYDITKMPIDNHDVLFDYMMAKKDLWAKRHDSIRVCGLPVEIFADTKDKQFPVGQGVYSLTHDAWIAKPEHGIVYDEARVEGDSSAHADHIDWLIASGDVESARQLKDQLWAGRGEAIKQDGEFAHNNLVYKDLRNKGYIHKLGDFVGAKTDADLSYNPVAEGVESLSHDELLEILKRPTPQPDDVQLEAHKELMRRGYASLPHLTEGTLFHHMFRPSGAVGSIANARRTPGSDDHYRVDAGDHEFEAHGYDDLCTKLRSKGYRPVPAGYEHD